MSIHAILLSLLLIAPWTTLVFSLQPQPPTYQRQHIAILDSSVDTSFLSTLSKRGERDFKVLSFDDQTHILLGNFPHQNHKRQNGWLNVEPNQRVTIAGSSTRAASNETNTNGLNTTVPGPYAIQTDVPSWGLSRLSQRQLPLADAFGYPNEAGKGVDIYIVDSGVDVNHTDFNGRAVWGGNFVPGSPDVDENGHGTILAGIAAGTEYGVAKEANIIAVKCLAANGTGDIGTIIEGLHYILTRIQSGPQPPKAIVNLSLVAQKSAALNQATDALTRAGAIVVAAAGNYHEDDDPSKRNACNYSPASASTAISVGSTDDKDQFASFSNDGKCVDILAPGTSILSDTKTNASLANVKMWYSGTSYSAPHVAGVLALLSATNTTSDHYQVIQQLYSLATPDIIKNVTEGTANLLAFNGVETSQMSSSMESTKHRASDASAVVPVFISAYASCLTLLSFWAWWL